MNRIFTIATLVGMACFAGCETVSELVGKISGSGKDPDAEFGVEMAEYVSEVSKARPGILLGISVTAAGSAAFDSHTYLVDSAGNILMPLIGPVQCRGLSLIELSEKLTERYKEYLQEPQVTAVFAYEPNKGMLSPYGDVKVLGEVNRPGPVDMPSTQDLTVMRALQLAGGTTQLANNSKVQVSHCDKDGKITKTMVDLVKIGKDGLAHKDIKLSAGDVVWVPMSMY